MVLVKLRGIVYQEARLGELMSVVKNLSLQIRKTQVLNEIVRKIIYLTRE